MPLGPTLVWTLAGYALASPGLPAGALAVPLVRQATSYSCGAAALQSVLAYWGAYDGGESGLYALLATTPKDGTDPVHLASGAVHFGLKAELREGMTLDELRRLLDSGDTVILDLQAWRVAGATVSWQDDWEDGHYVVLVGMDAKNAYVMDPSTLGRYAWLPLTELEERWHDYEDRDGPIRRYLRLGIVIRGKAAFRGTSRDAARML